MFEREDVVVYFRYIYIYIYDEMYKTKKISEKTGANARWGKEKITKEYI